MFYLSTIDLLIVGPSKTHPKRLRQTDGERFFEDRQLVEFTEKFRQSDHRVRDNKDTKTIALIEVMRSDILTCLSCLHS
jgi:hypothetical protein